MVANSIGARVRELRAQQKLSQTQLGAAVGLDQSAISRIEKGVRPVATHELLDLAEALSTTTGSLLGQSAGTPALVLAGRLTEPAAAHDAVDRAREILEAADLLERVAGPVPAPTPIEVSAPAMRSPHAHGRQLAKAARSALGLGELAPVPDLVAILEARLGAHVAFEPLPDGTHGLCATIPGATVILVNSTETTGRQRYTMAHELAHLLVGDLVGAHEVTHADGPKTHGEKRADSFAAHFLGPDDALRTYVGDRAMTPAVVGEVVHYFGLSLQAAGWRLVNAGLITKSERESLMAYGLRGVAAAAGLPDDLSRLPSPEAGRRPPRRLLSHAVDAYERGVIGAGLLADIVGDDDPANVVAGLAEIGHVGAARRRSSKAVLA